MSPRSRDPQSALLRLALALGLDARALPGLAAGIWLPLANGLSGRIRLASTRPGEASGYRPEVRLPVDPGRLEGGALRQLLDFQAGLMKDSGWYAGPLPGVAFGLGATRWYDCPVQAAQALKQAEAIALHACAAMAAPHGALRH